MSASLFSAAASYAAGNGPYSVAVADVNGDGRPDLVVADHSGGVDVLLGNGSGGFSTATSYAAGDDPISVVVTDVNGDGHPDLVVADQGRFVLQIGQFVLQIGQYVGGNVDVLLGNGSGGFSAATSYAAGISPNSVAVADVNGDGRPDLVVADENGGVDVLLGNGLGGFSAATSYATGSIPYSVAVADVNVDGRPDLVVADLNGGASVLLNGDVAQTYSLDATGLAGLSGSNTGIAVNEIPCFCRGTHIATPRGEVAVERLWVGDLVLTRSGAAVPLTWIGRGRSLVTAANPHARPIIVRAGALADGVPARNLYLTRGHSLLLDGVLIPVEYLVNDRSVLWDAQARVVEFFHLELEHHDVLLVDGAEAESYREDGNRHLFHNTDAPRHARHGMIPYAPVLTGGPEVDRVWARLLTRATLKEVALAEDADLHLLSDGVRVEGASEDPMRQYFHLERVPFELRIGSRVCNPVQLGTGRDPRDLGVALRRLALHGEGAELVLGWARRGSRRASTAPSPRRGAAGPRGTRWCPPAPWRRSRARWRWRSSSA